MPLIRSQDYARNADSGGEFMLLATDPGVYQDIPAWCRMHGHKIVSMEEENFLIRIVIRIA